mgnify:CR=1 FL=1
MENAQTLLSFGDAGWGDQLFAGLLVTLSLALTTLPFALLLGLLIALAGRSSVRSLRISANIFTTAFRGLPELLTLFIIYYGGQILVQQVVGLFSDTYVEVNGFVAGVIALTLVIGAFSSEVFAGALAAVPSGQMEAGESLGMRRPNAFRLIVFPQVFRLALPGLSNLWLILLKDTSLVSIIALDDLLRMSFIAVSNTKQPLFFYSVAALVYLTIAVISSFGLKWLETYGNRGQEERS